MEEALTIKPAQEKEEPSKAQVKVEEGITEKIDGLKKLVKGTRQQTLIRRSLPLDKLKKRPKTET